MDVNRDTTHDRRESSAPGQPAYWESRKGRSAHGKLRTSETFACDCGDYYVDVIESRGREGGYVYRVRRCRGCNETLSTHEVSADSYVEKKKLATLRGKLRGVLRFLENGAGDA